MSSIDLPRASGHIDWDRVCSRVPKGWYWLATAAVSGLLWLGIAEALVSATS